MKARVTAVTPRKGMMKNTESEALIYILRRESSKSHRIR
jgi:hypothetical protein